MKQSKLHSFVEALANTALGYVIAVVAQIVVFPLFGLAVTLGDNLLIGLCFTCVSIVRSYVLRRMFERFRKRGD